METGEIDSLLQSFEKLIGNPDLLHASAAALLGAGVGLLFRIVCKIILLYLASVAVLIIVLQSCHVVHVQINPQQVHDLAWRLIDILRRFRVQDHAFFAGGMIMGFKYGFFGWLKR